MTKSKATAVNLAAADLFHAEIARLRAEIERLRLAITRLASQDATLTDEEREAIDAAAHAAAQLHVGPDGVALAATLRGLLGRLA